MAYGENTPNAANDEIGICKRCKGQKEGDAIETVSRGESQGGTMKDVLIYIKCARCKTDLNVNWALIGTTPALRVDPCVSCEDNAEKEAKAKEGK